VDSYWGRTVLINCLLFHTEEEINKERYKNEKKNVRKGEIDVK
jgi:hypothetical protein